MQSQHDLRGGPGFALGARGHRQHGLDTLEALLDRFSRSAGRLDRHGLEMIAFDHTVFIFHAIDLEHLAAQPDHQGGAEIGMGGVAPLRPAQQVPAFAIGRHAAAAAMNKRDRAVDSGIIVKNAGSIDFFGNEFSDRCRAIHRGENADVVARAGFSVGPQIAFKRRALFWRQDLVIFGSFGKPIVSRKVVQAHVLLMHPVAGRNGFRGKSDRLPVFRDRFACADGRHRHLVPARNPLARGHAGGSRAGRDLVDGDNDIVVG